MVSESLRQTHVSSILSTVKNCVDSANFVDVNVFWALLTFFLLASSQISTAAPVINDPLAEWNTYMGGPSTTESSFGNHIATDADGNVYVSGSAPLSWGTPIIDHAGGGRYDAYVAKFDPSGTLLWNTFLGSSTDHDSSSKLTIDANGNVYATGQSGATWGSPVTAFVGPFQAGFVAKLNNNGELQWNTFVPANATTAVKTDSAGNAYVVGQGSTAWGTPIVAHSNSSSIDGFVVKLNSSGAVQWNTFFGAASTRIGVRDIVLDGNENIIVIGEANGPWGVDPIVDHAGADIFNAYVLQLNSSGERQWHTFMGIATGGNQITFGNSIGLDSDDNVYAAGISGTWGIPLNANAGFLDAYITKLNSSGAKQWHTFAGGTGSDGANSISLDKNGEIYIAGTSATLNWGSIIDTGSGGQRGFVAKFTSDGNLSWNFFDDQTQSLAVSDDFDIYTSGGSILQWGDPILPHQAPNVVQNGFLTKHCQSCFLVSTSAPPEQGSFDRLSQVVRSDDTAAFSITPSNGFEIDTVEGCGGIWTMSNPFVTGAITAACTIEATFKESGFYIVIPLPTGGVVVFDL